jgi:hypothetical protein
VVFVKHNCFRRRVLHLQWNGRIGGQEDGAGGGLTQADGRRAAGFQSEWKVRQGCNALSSNARRLRAAQKEMGVGN